MKKNFFTVLLIGLFGFCAPVFAEWKLVHEDPDRHAKHFFDPATVRQSGNHYKKVWVLSSYDEKQKGGYQSLKTFYEFDCKADRTRSYTMLLYPEVMAKGSTIGAHHDELKEWFEYPESSFFKQIAETVCKP
ncbi:hypothetical protein SAMN05421690_1002112 [Nitrosomonas sp. Nm51]|uniref:surface-adhesin E family protein n=1 Tax=Nitrosomonas sp. Nm51 TaxID=133720 RepID=UPI0008D3561E|nr:surface-adhesin E family protein [Nitrosomonas sp. Nm51]SEQ85439.1 hypothetical protein SAMN05421690_1002112 [Nitrosomonas sp. Nm51]